MHTPLSLRRVLVLALAAITALVVVPAAAAEAAPKKTNVKAMTRNVYLGADLTPVMTAPNQGALLVAGGQVWRQVQRTNFPGRAALLADEIEQRNPHVIGLQEVAHWRRDLTGNPDGPVTTAQETVYDFLKLLRSELQERGLRYKVAVVQNEFDAELPVDNSQPPDFVPDFDARLTMRDVILVKRPLKTRAPVGSNYSIESTMMVPIPGSPIPLAARRGWTKVDVIKQRVPFRVFNTHLEAFSEEHRELQAAELRQDRRMNHPRVVLLGDLNSDPDGGSPGAYETFVGDEYGEPFADRGVKEPTSGHDDELRDRNSTFTSYIDHILTKGKVGGGARTWLTGDDVDVFDQLGIWPSDHGGAVSKLIVWR